MEKKVLVVDDEMAILISFRKMLEKTGFIVDTADTMEKAESLLKSNTYEVVEKT